MSHFFSLSLPSCMLLLTFYHIFSLLPLNFPSYLVRFYFCLISAIQFSFSLLSLIFLSCLTCFLLRLRFCLIISLTFSLHYQFSCLSFLYFLLPSPVLVFLPVPFSFSYVFTNPSFLVCSFFFFFTSSQLFSSSSLLSFPHVFTVPGFLPSRIFACLVCRGRR